MEPNLDLQHAVPGILEDPQREALHTHTHIYTHLRRM